MVQEGKKIKGFPELERPPIAEVVCGFVFEPVPGIDPLLLGVYWDARSADFPKRQLHPALADEAVFQLGVFPIRAILLSEDDQFLLQLQHDRFFMNWRAVGKVYPRFSDRHGPGGLLLRALREYERFAEFIRKRLDVNPKVIRIELTKVDVLKRGEHWSNLQDLAELVPLTGVFSEFQRTDSREVNLRFVERGADGAAIIHLATAMDGLVPASVRIEARFAGAPEGTLADSFGRANEVLNDVFFKLIHGATERFGQKEGK